MKIGQIATAAHDRLDDPPARIVRLQVSQRSFLAFGYDIVRKGIVRFPGTAFDVSLVTSLQLGPGRRIREILEPLGRWLSDFRR